MTPKQYTRNIEREIKQLNRLIDFKILNGLHYREDSRKHKTLLQKLRHQHRRGLFSGIFSQQF